MTKHIMPRGHPAVSQEVKDQIIQRIREGGVSVSQAAQEHGLKPGAIYSWISRGDNFSSVSLRSSQIKKRKPGS